MKPLTPLLILICLFNSAFLPAQNSYSISGKPEIIIEGTSNVHDWEMKAEAMSGSGTITWNADGSFNITSLIVKINCNELKSSHGSIMDNKTYEALKAEKNPTITYKLTSPINNIKPVNGGTVINTTGLITIAGVSKTISMQVKVIAASNNQLSFEGSKSINMTDFGVSPPTAFMGAMKVGDAVIIKFKTSFSKVAGNL